MQQSPLLLLFQTIWAACDDAHCGVSAMWPQSACFQKLRLGELGELWNLSSSQKSAAMFCYVLLYLAISISCYILLSRFVKYSSLCNKKTCVFWRLIGLQWIDPNNDLRHSCSFLGIRRFCWEVGESLLMMSLSRPKIMIMMMMMSDIDDHDDGGGDNERQWCHTDSGRSVDEDITPLPSRPKCSLLFKPAGR